jgi:two-component system, NtrC family, sensor kinase
MAGPASEAQGTNGASPATHRPHGRPPAPTPSPMRAPRADAAPGRARPEPGRRRVLGTRGRVVVAFSALAAALAACFALGFVRLARMERGMAELLEHQDEMHLALELEEAVRDAYERQTRVLARKEQPAVADAGDELTAGLVRQLHARVDEPQASALVTRIDAAVLALDEQFRAELAQVAAQRGRQPAVHRFRLVLQVEEHVNGLVAALRDESVAQSASVEALRSGSVRLVVVFGSAIALFAVAIGLYLSRALARPLEALGEGAARIAGGDLDTRITVDGPEEFVALADKLNAMASDLKHHQERLVRSEKLAGLGRLAAGIAHEINNPLQVMLGYLTLPRGRMDVALAAQLDQVEREARRCKEIVDALKQLSMPGATAPSEPVDLRAIAEEVAEALHVTMPQAPPVRVDGNGAALGRPAPFRQAIFNLVKNAAEAAGPSGLVEVEVRCEGGTARVEVSDTGAGIPAELRDRLFEPFFTTKATGTGLGLALARAIAQAYGGDVDLETDPSGAGGTRFTLRAPRCAEGAWA